jgi:flagellar basal body P-ring formation protein FlgA
MSRLKFLKSRFRHDLRRFSVKEGVVWAILNRDSHAPLSQGGSAANAARAGVTQGQTLQGYAVVTSPRAILRANRIFAAFIFLCIAVHVSARPELPAVTVLGQVSVQAPRVFLADLLTQESRQAINADERMRGITVAVAPLPGKIKLLDGGVVRDKLTDIGITSGNFSLRVPESIRIHREGQTLLAGDIENSVKEQFLPMLPWPEVRLQEIGISEPVVLPHGKVELTFQLPPRTDLARPFYLSIDFRVDGQLAKRAYVRTVLTIFDTIAVTRREVTAKEKITVDDVRFEKRALRSSLQNPVRESSFFDGKRPRVNIAAGEALFEGMFMTVPLIHRGDSVTMLFDDGKIRIAAQGQSLAAGSKGDRIRVMNVTSRANLIAEVVDEKTVRIINPLERTEQ